MRRHQHFLLGQHLYIDLLALLAGMIGGFCAIFFLYIIKLGNRLIYGDHTMSFAMDLPWWRIAVPLLLAGLIAGIISQFMRYKRPFGVAGVVDTCALRNSHMPLKEGFLNALLHKFTLGLGISAGREGPAIHLAATLLTPILQRIKVDHSYHVLLVGCAAAGAIGSSFNTMLAGAFFAWEVIVGRGKMQYILPLAIGGGGGLLLSLLVYGPQGAFYIPDIAIHSHWVYPFLMAMGASAGIVGGFFVSLNTWIYEQMQTRHFPVLARTLLGGVLLAGLAIFFPFVLGVGYFPIYLELFAPIGIATLLVMFAAKILASTVTLAFALGGGVWTLCLILGAQYGAIMNELFVRLLPDAGSNVELFIMMGMAGFITSILGAPITAILFVIEHNGDFTVVFGTLLMVVCTAQIVSHLFFDSFYSVTLMRDQTMGWGGHKMLKRQKLACAHLIEPALTVDGREKLSDAIKKLDKNDEQAMLFITDSHDGRFIGVLGWHEIFRYDSDETSICQDIMGIKRIALQQDELEQLWDVMDVNPDTALPVLDGDGKLVGCIKRNRILQAIKEQVEEEIKA